MEAFPGSGHKNGRAVIVKAIKAEIWAVRAGECLIARRAYQRRHAERKTLIDPKHDLPGTRRDELMEILHAPIACHIAFDHGRLRHTPCGILCFAGTEGGKTTQFN